MNYTSLTLFGLGMLGIMVHILVDVNKLNHQPNINTSVGKYFKIEWAAICLSIVVVVIATIVRNEIVELEKAGKWLGLASAAIGYMANSIVTGFTNKVQKFIDSDFSGVADKIDPTKLSQN